MPHARGPVGGQMVHSLIGLFCGVFGNGPDYRQLTHGIFDDIFRDLGPAGELHFQPGHTRTTCPPSSASRPGSAPWRTASAPLSPAAGTALSNTMITLHGRTVVPGYAEGEALVSPEPISGWSGFFQSTRLLGTAPIAMIITRISTKSALGAVVTRVPAVTTWTATPAS